MRGEFDRLDELIIGERAISALIWLRQTFDCSIKEAIEFFDGRYHELRKTRPDDFTKGPEEYGQGVYT